MNENGLATILLQSRYDNKKADITGVLLYFYGQIIQVLEGKKLELDRLYARIQRDKRHTDVTTLINQSIDQRLFSSWSMGYQTLTSSQLEEFTVIVDLNNRTASDLSQQPILELLREFCNTNQ